MSRARLVAHRRTPAGASPSTERPGCQNYAVGVVVRAQLPHSPVEDVLDRLRARGSRVTTSRRLLVRSLVEAGGHRTAEELAAEVQSLAPDVHISTIYRNLEELERLGVVMHAHLGHGPATYHLTPAAHGHLVCEKCGGTFEAPDELFGGLAASAMTSFGFEIDPHHFAVLGRCAACRAPE
jgi:Fur family ferric uptake transcriptional regulator